MYTGLYTEREFRSLDVMATFVVDEMFRQLDRSFFVDSLEFLQGFCYIANKRDMVAGMLQEQRTFGYRQLNVSLRYCHVLGLYLNHIQLL